MDNRGVMLATKRTADLRKRSGSELFDQIHSDLPWNYDGLGITFFLQLGLLDPVLFGNRFLNGIDGYTAILRVCQMLQDLLRHSQIYRGAGERGISHQFYKRALELTHIGLGFSRDKSSHIF